jgi:competence protein ComEA
MNFGQEAEDFFHKHKNTIIFILTAIGIGFIIFKLVMYKLSPQTDVKCEIRNIDNATPVTIENITVHISGAVNKPGVYSLKKGALAVNLLKEAGGATEAADLSQINLAAELKDNEQIDIPYAKARTSAASSLTGRPVNINRAEATELESIPGIGPKYAGEIVLYRKKNGPFRNLEDLGKVKGIGPKRLQQMRSHITL